MNIMLIVGAVISLFGVYLFRRTSARIRSALTANGKVIAVRESEPADSTDAPSWYPTVSFLANDGQRYEITGASSTRKMSVGSKIKVAYDPKNPGQAWEHRTAGPWLGAFLVTAIGIGLTIAGMVE